MPNEYGSSNKDQSIMYIGSKSVLLLEIQMNTEILVNTSKEIKRKNCRNPLQFEDADEKEKLCHLFPKCSDLENSWLHQMLKNTMTSLFGPERCKPTCTMWGFFNTYLVHMQEQKQK